MPDEVEGGLEAMASLSARVAGGSPGLAQRVRVMRLPGLPIAWSAVEA